MQFSNPTTVPSSFTVTGGTIDTVNNPVSTDPASTIAVVTTSVPYLFRDTGFWPALSGEQFPPTRAAATTYGSISDRPAYICAAPASGAPVDILTSPNMPRTGFNGKRTVKLSCTIRFTYNNVTIPSDSVLCAIGLGNYGGTRFAGFRIDSINHAANQWAIRPGYGNPGLDFTGGLVNLADQTDHTLTVQLNPDGSVGSWFVDGVNIRNAVANIWGDGLQVATWRVTGLFNSGWTLYVSNVAEEWT